MQPPLVRLAGYQRDESVLSQALQTVCEALRERDWGFDLELQTDVTAAQEKASELFNSVEVGQRQLCYMASGYLSARVAELAVLDLPFSIAERSAALEALDGPAGQFLSDAVARHTGLQVLAFWDNGFRHVTNAVHPIVHPADCQGMVIRTLDSAHYRDALSALGFIPMTTDVKDLVRVVRDGVVQAQENPLTNFLNFSLWHHHPFVSLTHHNFGVVLFVCPRNWYLELSEMQRTCLQEAVALATQAQRAQAALEDHRALAELTQHGIAVLNQTQIDRPAMHEATRTVRERQLKLLPSQLIDAYLG
jgi:hypothetical protein